MLACMHVCAILTNHRNFWTAVLPTNNHRLAHCPLPLVFAGVMYQHQQEMMRQQQVYMQPQPQQQPQQQQYSAVPAPNPYYPSSSGSYQSGMVKSERQQLSPLQQSVSPTALSNLPRSLDVARLTRQPSAQPPPPLTRVQDQMQLTAAHHQSSLGMQQRQHQVYHPASQARPAPAPIQNNRPANVIPNLPPGLTVHRAGPVATKQIPLLPRGISLTKDVQLSYDANGEKRVMNTGVSSAPGNWAEAKRPRLDDEQRKCNQQQGTELIFGRTSVCF